MESTRPHISTSDNDGVLVITVLDERLTEQQQVDDWQDQMAAAIGQAKPAGVVIDLRHVEYMTSVAMLPLIATRALADKVQAKLILCNLSPAVLQVLTVTQLIVERGTHARHLAMAETLEDAVKMLSASNEPDP